MKTLGILFTIILLSLNLTAQTYMQPPFTGQSTSAVQIGKVQITKTHTIVHMSCTAPDEFVYGGWACFTNSAFLEDVKTKKKYKLIKSRGIPKCPNQFNFSKPGQTIRFKLYFERVRHNVRNIHIIEDLNNVANPFNFFNVYLKPVA
jgi:hypothetical protein